jgi:hypothetical protein
MGFPGAAKGGADAVLQVLGGEQPRRLRHPLLARQPLGLTKTNLTQGQYATSANRWGVSS